MDKPRLTAEEWKERQAFDANIKKAGVDPAFIHGMMAAIKKEFSQRDDEIKELKQEIEALQSRVFTLEMGDD